MIKATLAEHGYAHYQPHIHFSGEERDLIRNEFLGLQPDTFAPEHVGRFRRYGNGVIIPWSHVLDLHWMPPVLGADERPQSGYNQGGFNPEHNNVRYFDALSSDIRASPILRQLVLNDFSYTSWTESEKSFPIYFGVHFVKLRSCGPAEFGVSSPDCFHQDGEPFTFGHLVYRSPCTDGGVNYVGKLSATNKRLNIVKDEEILKSFTLINFLESFVVVDSAVSHYVAPITNTAPELGIAERWMILIDFSCTSQDI